MSTMEIINLNVIENDGFTKLDVDQPESTQMEMEQVEIIHAVSPTVDLERMTNGVKIKVNDYRGSSSEIVYDGPKGEPGEVTQAEFDELSESVDDLVKDVSDLNSALNEAAQDETGLELLAAMASETAVTENVLQVIGTTFESLPQDESAQDIRDALKLEADRLAAIYDLWLAEKESA